MTLSEKVRIVSGLSVCLALSAAAPAQPQGPVTLRIATFCVQDLRTADINKSDTPRLKQLADIIQHLRPNILLLSGIDYDIDGGPDVPAGQAGLNAQRFADRYLAVQQSSDVEALHFTAFMAPTNSGQTTGLDLDGNGRIVTTYPSPLQADSDEARDYSGDCWGPGSYPGQRGMALLVDSRLSLLTKEVRTFRLLPWDFVPGSAMPESGSDADLRKKLRLSSASHWDVPVRLPNSTSLHLLCSNPTSFASDSSMRLNARRNHDEIRFWADYLEAGGGYIVDDANVPGGLADNAPFVIFGDLKAAPGQASTFKDPIASTLFTTRRINSQVVPKADLELPGLGPPDTSASKLRTDYVLPSSDIAIVAAGVWRHPATSGAYPSDHYPVWMDLRISPPSTTTPDR